MIVQKTPGHMKDDQVSTKIGSFGSFSWTQSRMYKTLASSAERELLADGCELEVVTRTVAMDPLEEVATRQIRARLWRKEELLKEEVHTQKVEDYSKNELVLMLEQAGFSEIQIVGDYSNEPATADHEVLVFVARK
jgi:hypothetical protein